MEITALKSTTNVLLSNILIRLISLCVLVLLARFAYVIAVKGHSCDSFDLFFFRQTLNSASSSLSDADHRRAYYSSVFKDLVTTRVLSTNSTSLCILEREKTLALREIGVSKSVGISLEKFLLASIRYAKTTFDFEFLRSPGLDRATKLVQLASEVSRTLKPGCAH